jgi:beta-barrel assembly-enhancing protease
MRRLIAVALALVGCTAIYFLQRAKAEAPISPAPVFYLIADSEREAERVPLALTRVSDADEMKIGEQIAKEYGLDDPNRFSEADRADAEIIERYLNSVGACLTPYVQRHAIHYHFYLDADRSLVNAFALPGGNIVVGRGLLSIIESEDELAAVLGHEITHVDQRHAIERLQYELTAQKYGLEVFYELGLPALEIFRAGYTKEQELEADRLGLGLAVAGDYSAAGGVDLMKRFQKLEEEEGRPQRAGSPIEEFAQVSVDSLHQYFLSHPPAAERLAAMRAEIKTQGWPLAEEKAYLLRPIFLTDQAEALDEAGDFSNSINRFQQALTISNTYARAWHGLARATWRSGDASATLAPATEAATRNKEPEDWQILSRALILTQPQTQRNQSADVKFAETVSNAYGQDSNPDSHLEIYAELAAMRLIAGDQDDAVQFWQKNRDSTSAPELRVRALRELSWWYYHTRRLEDAAKILEDAHQILPQDSETELALAWVETDLGRQADAEQFAHEVSGSAHVDAADDAVIAVILSRTNEHASANSRFEDAARYDPAWMVQRWVQNNYSSASAAVIKQLQAQELARRKKEADEIARLKKDAESHRGSGK